MKKMILNCVAFFLFVSLNAQQKKKINPVDTMPLTFEVEHSLTLDGKEVGEFSYCLHHGGEKLDSAFLKKTKSITLDLKRNEIYTLSYHKDGYSDKFIMIDTKMPKGKEQEDIFVLAFEIEINPTLSLHKDEFKDHPVAVMKYHKELKDFDFSTKYHEAIHHKEKVTKGKKKK